MVRRKLFTICCALMACTVAFGAMAAAKTKSDTANKQSAIQNGTKVRTRIEAKGIYDQECYDAYYSCMDQFCITDNSNGGSCACSDLNAGYEKRLNAMQDKLAEAERISTVEVEKVKAGANADIIFTGKREYDKDGNLINVDDLAAKEAKAAQRASLMAMFDTQMEEDEDSDVFDDDISTKTGAALFAAAEELCQEQIPDKCAKDEKFLHQIYARQIVSDCKGYENLLKTKEAEADVAIANAENAVRAAQKESFDSANKYDLGTCMVEFKKCMQTEDACGQDWGNCVFTIASENMQNNVTKSTAGTKISTINTYDITESTMEILSSKRTICEKVLTNCVAVRDNVWPHFLREAAPTIKLAESKVESKFRQSCLTDISTCIQKACKDDIVGKGEATMDACLARPDMVRSFCKVEIDPCERMEPQIWAYVKDKLAAMRVDVCTAEVKDCFTDETRCGKDFSNCIGMDYDYIHDMCPVEKLVVCKQNNPEFSMADLDSMLMGLYLNIDNSAIEQCQNLVDEKMIEFCGSTTDCNRFAADDTLGTGSLHSQKIGDLYRITGMISFGSIKMGDSSGKTPDGADGVLGPGEIGVKDYLQHVRATNKGVPNADAIISSIEEELNNIAGTINRTIEMIAQDPKIQFCISGRDLSQITGNKKDRTTARFPNLLNQVKMQIAISALRKAQDNYNKKYNEEIAKATKDASADIAQYMCQTLPYSDRSLSTEDSVTETPMNIPYAIYYDVGVGLTRDMLTMGGSFKYDLAGASASNDSTTSITASNTATLSANAGVHASASATAPMGGGGVGATASAGIGASLSNTTSIGVSNSRKQKISIPGGTREKWAVFDRDSRICHYCTATLTTSCSSKKLGKKELNCTEAPPVERCEDIPM